MKHFIILFILLTLGVASSALGQSAQPTESSTSISNDDVVLVKTKKLLAEYYDTIECCDLSYEEKKSLYLELIAKCDEILVEYRS